MQTTKFGLKLVHKGLILISIPLIFGVVLILIFESLMQSFMHLRHNTDRAVAVTNQINKMTPALFALEASLLDQQAVPDRSTFAFIQQDLDETARLAAKETIAGDSVLNDVTAINNQWTNTKELLLSSSTPEQSRRSLRNLQGSLNRVAQRELDICTRNKDEDKLLNERAQQIIGVAIALNVIVCPLVALYFAQTLSRRLGVLVENSRRFASGQPLNPTVGGNDEINQLDQVFREMAAKIQQAERARMDFFTMISHDLRTPLNSIQATLTLIADGIYGSVSPEGTQRVKAAEETSEQLIGMVSQLLDLEKMKSGKLDLEFRPVRLRELLENAKAAVSGFAEFKNISMQVSETDASVLGDEKRLTQVVVNLLSNAIKFAPDNSAVDITVREADGQQIEVRVTDGGRGVAPESQVLIFDRFRQAERADSDTGSGLGLAICKEIVEEHYGTIGVESANGKGSTFWFKLKKLDESTTAAAPR
jgi:signal transduction histidine kinase